MSNSTCLSLLIITNLLADKMSFLLYFHTLHMHRGYDVTRIFTRLIFEKQALLSKRN